MSLICSQAHAQWLTTKLCRPKTLLTLSIGLKHFSPLLGVLETDFLVFWKLFFNVPYFFFFFFLGFLEAYFLGILETDFLGILEADFLGFGSWFLYSFFFSWVFWKLIFWVF